MIKKRIVFYIVGGLLSVLTIIYIVYLLNLAVSQISVVSRTDLLRVPEIATFDFKKYEQIEKLR